jgi:P27 family predicted phage terminase small subunit
MPGTSQSGGRNKKTLRAHALAGTGRRDRGTKKTPTSADAPDPPVGRPPIPIGLIGPALDEWTRMVGRLEAAKTLSIVDDAALFQYCSLFAETEAIVVAHRANVALVVKLQKAIDKLRDGELIVEAITQIVQLKKLEVKSTAQLRQGHMALRQYLVELGMTPAARSRVKVPDNTPVEADPFAEFDTTPGLKH